MDIQTTYISKLLVKSLATFTLFCLSSNQAQARDIFVSPSLKTDVNQLKFRNLLDLERICFQGGDRIFLRAGSYFRNELKIVPCSGASGTIAVNRYGAGNNPYIIPSKRVDTDGLAWQKVNNPTVKGQVVTYLKNKPIYRIGPLDRKVKQVYFNDQRMMLARSPNDQKGNGKTPNYYTINKIWENDPNGSGLQTFINYDHLDNPEEYDNPQTNSGFISINEYGVQSTTQAIIRTTNWSFRKIKVSGANLETKGFYSSESLRAAVSGDLDPTSRLQVRKGFGFVLVNSLLFLDRDREWYYDPESKYLYLWAPDSLKPSARSVEVVFDDQVSSVEANFFNNPISLTIRNLNIFQSARAGIKVIQGKSVDIRNVRISTSEETGISIWKMSGKVHIQGVTINRSAGSGLVVSSAQGQINIWNNNVNYSGSLANQSRDLGFNMYGIRAGGGGAKHVSIVGNTVNSSGYSGIIPGMGNNGFYVAANTVKNSCTILNDCGALYINGKDTLNWPSSQKGRQWFYNNTVEGTVGNINGTPNGFYPAAIGIYLDHGMSFTHVVRNKIRGTNSFIGAIFVNQGNYNSVRRNNIANSNGPAIGLAKQRVVNYPVTGAPVGMACNYIVDNKIATGGQLKVKNKNFAVIRLMDRIGEKYSDMGKFWNNTLIHETQSGYHYQYTGKTGREVFPSLTHKDNNANCSGMVW